MKKVISLAVLTAMLTGCMNNGATNNAGYGSADGFGYRREKGKGDRNYARTSFP